MYKTWGAVFAVAAVATCSAQSSKQLTARELFFVPTGATITRNEAPQAKPKAPTSNKTTTPPVQVAKSQPKAKAPASGGAPPVVRPPQFSAPSGEPAIQIVSASYSGPRPLGLRYSILKRDPSGDWNEVNPDTTFHSGDKLRVRVESNEPAYLYIVAKGSSGNWDVLFPSKDINGGDNRIDANAEEILPNRRGQWTLDDRKGEERLFLVLSRKPVADLDSLIYDLNKPGGATTPAKTPENKKADPPRLIYAARTEVDDRLIGRLRNQMMARDLVFEKVDDKVEDRTTHRKETAAYVVEKSGAPDARLVADIRINHD